MVSAASTTSSEAGSRPSVSSTVAKKRLSAAAVESPASGRYR